MSAFINLPSFAIFFHLLIQANSQLIYINGAVLKFILALTSPINVESPGRSLIWTMNIQGIYRLPDNLTYFQPYKIVQKRSDVDSWSTLPALMLLENVIKRWGNECLERLICETAEADLESDDGDPVPGKLFRILFTPNHDWSTEYHLAHSRGLLDTHSCSESYDCSMLDKFLV